MAKREGGSSTHLLQAYDDKQYATIQPKTRRSSDSTSISEEIDLLEEQSEYISKNPFLDPDVAAHWRKVYEEADYECRHAFDPTLTWTKEEEKAIVRKLDWRICTWAVRESRWSVIRDSLNADFHRPGQCIMFFALQVDRGNLSQALSDDMLNDLGMNTDG
jgi:hypothetical protein